MENYKITSAQISASSQYDLHHAPNQGRLNFKHSGSYSGGWSSSTDDLNQWFQIDLGIDTSVTSVATQGRNLYYSQWVTHYKLLYGNDGNSFQVFRQQGEGLDKVWYVIFYLCNIKTFMIFKQSVTTDPSPCIHRHGCLQTGYIWQPIWKYLRLLWSKWLIYWWVFCMDYGF